MNVKTSVGEVIDSSLICNYFQHLVNLFFKILPMREENEKTLSTYIEGLQVELLGCRSFIPDLNDSPNFLTLLSILQYLIDNENCPTSVVKREVFKAISICKKIASSYSESEG